MLNTKNEMGLSVSVRNEYTRCEDFTKSGIDHIFMKTKHNRKTILPIIVQTHLSHYYTISAQIVFDKKTVVTQKENLK